MKYHLRDDYTFVITKTKSLKNELGKPAVVIDDKINNIKGQEFKLEPVEKPVPAAKKYSIAEMVSLIVAAVMNGNKEAGKEINPLFAGVNKAIETKGLQLEVFKTPEKIPYPKQEGLSDVKPTEGEQPKARSAGQSNPAQNATVSSVQKPVQPGAGAQNATKSTVQAVKK